MSISPELAKAYEEFESALEKLMGLHPATYRSDGTMVTGWTIIVDGLRYLTDEEIEEDWSDHPAGKMHEPITSNFSYVRLGQSATLTRGMVEHYLDRCRVSD